MKLVEIIQEKVRAALSGMVPAPERYAVVKPTRDAKHGDYQVDCAMALAKVLGKKPREIAQEIVGRIPRDGIVAEPEIAGPGFINLRLTNDWMATQVGTMAADQRLSVMPAPSPKRFVVDFSSPNVAKPMHVGHLRSTIIGDALTRLLRFLGHAVVTDNHLGDWGTQFGMLIYGYRNLLDQEAFAADPVRELARIYVEVRRRMKSDEDAADDPVAAAARAETAKLHAGDAENRRLWESFMPACLEDLNCIYRRLGISFDHTLGESFYQPMLPAVVQNLLEKGIAQKSNDAVIIRLAEDQPPALVQKRDGAFTYMTTDLATIRYRIDTWNADAILYVVDFRQSFHFQNLFQAARRWGFDKVALEHVSFGSVLGKDGKPLKTREGGVVELNTLLDEAVERAAAVYEKIVQESRERGEEVPDLSEEEKRTIHETVGIGAVKYADFCQNRTTDYKFDFDKMLAMNGNTATYMQYAYARNRSILRKAGADVDRFRTAPPAVIVESPFERALALQLLRFEEALLAAAADYQPSAITGYLWDLAKTYSGFFQNCPVLKAETPALRDSRLLLCDLTARVIKQGLELLGIGTVERM